LTFKEHFEEELLEGLIAMGFEKPTPVQEQAIPVILQNRDLIACAQTGTGKTAAFLLPIMNKIIKDHRDTIDTLIIVPTRSFEQEKKALTQGANIIIATPGRLIAHINQGYVKFGDVKHLVLDEADRMLDMGFSEDISRIISFLPKQRQTLLFSATMPPKIRSLATKIMKQPEHINIAVSKPADKVIQAAYFVQNNEKVALIRQLLIGKKMKSIIIFSSTKSNVKELERELKKIGLNAAAIHSDLTQDQRNEVLRSFRNRKLQILVATDIVSRGIDIDSIELVVNYDVPGDAEDYIHRIGRTARAEATGVALTFINPHDRRKFRNIEQMLGSEVKKIPVPQGAGGQR
jgi:ATP-dependent RNA helicase RhlE